MERMTAAQRGWINLRPDVEDEDAGPKGGAVRAGIFKVFSGLGPAVPLCTWVAPEPKGKPPHAEIGMMHRAGPKVVKTLAAGMCGVPDRWVVLGDHPKRGLVVAIPPETPSREV